MENLFVSKLVKFRMRIIELFSFVLMELVIIVKVVMLLLIFL